MSNLTIAVSSLGFLPFLFIFWRRLKEDYTSGQIFSAGFYILFSILVFILIFVFGLSRFLPPSSIFSPTGLWFWGAVFGFGVGLCLAIWKLNLKFFESFEAAGVGFLTWLSLVFLVDSVMNSSVPSLFSFVAILGLVVLFFFLDGRYKKFTWYHSGKIGFSGLATLGIFFFIRAMTALVFPFVLSFAGTIDALISAFVSFILFLLLYNLSGR